MRFISFLFLLFSQLSGQHYLFVLADDESPSSPIAAPSSPVWTPANDLCASEDAALDRCLDLLGATESEERSCETCIDAIAYGALDCDDAKACQSLLACPCKEGCEAEVLAYGTCEIDQERMEESGDTLCGAFSCPLNSGSTTIARGKSATGGSLAAPTSPIAEAPSSPVWTPANDLCASEDAALDRCLDLLGATESEERSCETCIDAIAYGALDCDDAKACQSLLACPCKEGCEAEVLAYGTCEIDQERQSEKDIVCGGAIICVSSSISSSLFAAAEVTNESSSPWHHPIYAMVLVPILAFLF